MSILSGWVRNSLGSAPAGSAGLGASATGAGGGGGSSFFPQAVRKVADAAIQVIVAMVSLHGRALV